MRNMRSHTTSRISLIGKLISTIALGLLLATFSLPGCAQVLYGSLTGTVLDPSGAVVAGAKVEAAGAQTGITSQATTDSAGIYRLTTLLPGTYNVTISAPGFA